jgi:glycine betaine/proline transport system substrate-binding protein
MGCSLTRHWPALARRAGAGLLLAAALICEPGAQAADPPECRSIRLADVGWTDVTSVTAVLARLTRELGYEPQTEVLSLPATFAALQSGSVDVFLGNWMPAQEAERRPYADAHSIDIVGPNLSGAKYTLAVPAYAYDAGLREFADIARFHDALDGTLYGIDPGSDGNRLLLQLIKDDRFGLGNFKLNESSEPGMLAAVAGAIHERRPVVFLAWDPHPMNVRFDMRYLAGGDAVFGPNFGGASVYTLTRKGYAAACPNLGHLLSNLKFSTHGESQVMSAILDEHKAPDAAAAGWLAANGPVVAGWLDGVTTLDGRPARDVLEQPSITRGGSAFENWITSHKLPVGEIAGRLTEYLHARAGTVLQGVADLVRLSANTAGTVLGLVPPPLLILLLALGAGFIRRSVTLAAFVAGALLFILNQGYWAAALETLALVLVASLMSITVGVPIGYAAAHRPGLHAALRPVLDLMQILPPFAYLIPTLAVFGLGVVPGLVATAIFALPAPIRMTQQGISSVPRALMDVGTAFGANPLQLLLKVELPSAAPAIIAGIAQCTTASLSMIVVAALVGVGGLGIPVVRALNTVQVAMGVEAGLVLALLAVILDRITRPRRASGSSR